MSRISSSQSGKPELKNSTAPKIICRMAFDNFCFYAEYNRTIKAAGIEMLGKGKKMKTIRVTGKGQIKVHPDMTRITMTLEGKNRDYSKTLRRSSEDTEMLKDILSAHGFERPDLKTLSFDVDTEYENYRDSHGDYKRRFAGYSFSHTLKVEFESDNDRLGRILYSLANCPVKPEFRISYTVKEPEKAKNSLLGNAVTDAMKKAAVLTKAAGVKYKEIQTIDYSWSKMDLEVSPSDGLMLKACTVDEASASYNMDIEPDDIEVTDTVTVIWEIE